MKNSYKFWETKTANYFIEVYLKPARTSNMSEVDQLIEEIKQISIEGTNDVAPIVEKLELSVDGVAKLLKSGQIKNVVVLCGAGISVSAGVSKITLVWK